MAQSPLRASALRMLEAGLQAIDTGAAVRRAVRLEGNSLSVQGQTFDLSGAGRLVLVGVGKCALEAASALEDILGERISDGLVIDIHPGKLKRVEALSGDHPFPTERNMDATRRLIGKLRGLAENDLVLAIISGGGSTLLCQPQNHTCLEERQILECLFRSGADIRTINTVRKHTSSARGGHLAEYAYPARVVSLIFSDVPGDDLASVASGPTFKDETTGEDARKILDSCMPGSALARMELMETPKEEKYFEKVSNILIVSNRVALEAMAEQAKMEGFAPEIISASFSGEARELGAKAAREISLRPKRTALLYGGESTVSIKGGGKGGRNQELALGALSAMEPQELIVSLASDGRDNGDHAGALCDIITLEKARAAGLSPEEYLARNDSYAFFEKTGDFLSTGETGSNVSDLILALKE